MLQSVSLVLTGYQTQSAADEQHQRRNREGRGGAAVGGGAGGVGVLRLLRHVKVFTLLTVNAS